MNTKQPIIRSTYWFTLIVLLLCLQCYTVYSQPIATPAPISPTVKSSNPAAAHAKNQPNKVLLKGYVMSRMCEMDYEECLSQTKIDGWLVLQFDDFKKGSPAQIQLLKHF